MKPARTLSCLVALTLLLGVAACADIGEPQNCCAFDWEENGPPFGGSLCTTVSGTHFPVAQATADPGLTVVDFVAEPHDSGAHGFYTVCQTPLLFPQPLCAYSSAGSYEYAWDFTPLHNAGA